MRRDLSDGLVLRFASRADADELVEFNAAVLGDDDAPGTLIADWTRDLFDLPHPTFRVDDVTVVEDTATGRIVSALFLIAQIWSYAGIPITVGQPELIGTHPDYRRRGLVRAQFDVIHDRSAASGHLWQYIGGIPWYYRQFGYSYGLDLPPQPVWMLTGSDTPVSGSTVRPATLDDVAFLAGVEAAALNAPILSGLRGPGGWELELRRRPGALPSHVVNIVEHEATAIGYLVHDHKTSGGGLLSVRAAELLPGRSWLEPTAAMLTHLREWVGREPGDRGVRFALPEGHPALRAASTRLGRGPGGPYGFYVRVPDVVALLRAVSAVLDARIAASAVEGLSGEASVDLYTESLRLTFNDGRLTSIERGATSVHDSDVSLPPDAFVQLILGNRGLVELERTVADCHINTDAGGAVVDALFPRLKLYSWEMG
ncbi:MAG: GNAT family N-acetyltransferase [Acidimicrobiales bacterium]